MREVLYNTSDYGPLSFFVNETSEEFEILVYLRSLLKVSGIDVELVKYKVPIIVIPGIKGGYLNFKTIGNLKERAKEAGDHEVFEKVKKALDFFGDFLFSTLLPDLCESYVANVLLKENFVASKDDILETVRANFDGKNKAMFNN